MNHGYNPAPDQHLIDAVRLRIGEYTQQLVRSSQMTQFDASEIVRILQHNIAIIASAIIADPAAYNGVSYQLIDQHIMGSINQLMTQLRGQGMNQPQYGGYQRPNYGPANQGGGFMGNPNQQYVRPNAGMMAPRTHSYAGHPQQFHSLNTGGMSMSNGPESPPPRVIPNAQMVQEAPIKIGLTKVVPGGQELAYNVVSDPEATALSITCPSGPVFDVRRKDLITDSLGKAYHYSDVVSYINEPSVERAINNFVRTNNALVIDPWIVRLSYSRFVLREIKAVSCSAIDLSPLKNPEIDKVPVDTTIQKVIKSICERNANIVKCLEQLLIQEFNRNLAKYVRIDDDIAQIISVEELADIGTLASMRDRTFGDLTFHRNYEAAILRCFIETVGTAITEKTKLGYYDTADIAPDLLTHPDFVIREQGLCEREMDITNPDFINAIATRYTAFANIGTVVVANFIPDELESDLDGNVIVITKTTNPFEMLISTQDWRQAPPMIIMTVGNERRLVVETGVTLDGSPIMFKSSLPRL